MPIVDDLLPLGGQVTNDCPKFKRVPCYEECRHVYNTMHEYYNFDVYSGKVFHNTLTESFLELQDNLLKEICEFTFDECTLGRIAFFSCVQCDRFCSASDIVEGVETQEASYTLRTNWSNTFIFNKFEGQGLTDAVLTIDFDTDATVGYENENLINSGTFDYDQTTSYNTTGITVQANAFNHNFIANPPTYDGITDFAGTSGDTQVFVDTDNVVVNLPLIDVEGVGTYDLNFNVDSVVNIIASSGMQSSVDTFATANVSVVYNYSYDNCDDGFTCSLGNYKIIDKCNCTTKIIDFTTQPESIKTLYDNTVASLLDYGNDLTANVEGVEFMATQIFGSDAQVIKYHNDVMYLDVGRLLDDDEISVLNFFKKALPIPFGSSVTFVGII